MARKRVSRNVGAKKTRTAANELNAQDSIQENQTIIGNHPGRYSKRIRKPFHPFTIPFSTSSKITQHVHTKVIRKKRVGGRYQKSGSTTSATRRDARMRRGMVKKRKLKKGVQQRKTVTVVEKRVNRKNDLLKPRPEIDEVLANPYIHSPECPEFVSVSSYSRIMSHRLVIQKDIDQLRQTANDMIHYNVSALEWSFCPDSVLSAEGQAILTEDYDLMKTIADLKKDNNVARAELEPLLLNQYLCGTMNVYMLGHSTGDILMTRGGREGINALLSKNLNRSQNIHDQLHIFVRSNVSLTTLTFLRRTYEADFSGLVHKAIRYGHRHLAAYMIEAFSSYNFNDLHIAVLRNNTEPLKKFMPVSVIKRGRLNRNITPLHCAAINPNVTYLKALLSARQHYGSDLDGWNLIHYAAVCEGTAPLKYLLSLGVSPAFVNKKKQIPLHCAVRAGRMENCQILIDAMQKYEKLLNSKRLQVAPEQSLESILIKDEGNLSLEEPPPLPLKRRKKIANVDNKALINAKSTAGKTALYMAASRGHTKIVELLLDSPSIVVDGQISARRKKLTALMVACAKGYLDTANVLIDVGGATIERGDKLKRTALTHAVINGQAHVVAMLLRRGASPLFKDTSGNTPAHYAAAFGWFECLVYLTKADPNCLAVNNDWHLSPLSVAYMKGHFGIMEWLVNGPYAHYVDINCPDEFGSTLLSCVIKSYACFDDKKILSQLRLLIAKGASGSIKDVASNSPLHNFCTVKYKLQVDCVKDVVDDEEENMKRLTKHEYQQCFDLLRISGGNVLDKNENGYNPLYLALHSGNLFLAELIFSEILVVDSTLQSLDTGLINENGSTNILHFLLSLPYEVCNQRSMWTSKDEPCDEQYNIIPLLNKIIINNREKMQHWLWQKDSNGRTPLLIFCEHYSHLRSVHYKEKFMEKFLTIMCSVVRRLLCVDPKIMFQRVAINSNIVSENSTNVQSKVDNDDACVVVDDNDDDNVNGGSCDFVVKETGHNSSVGEGEERNKRRSVFSYALQASVDFTTSVSVVIDSEIHHITNLLLITLVEAAKEYNLLLDLLNQCDCDGYTPLLRMVSSNNLIVSMYLLREAHAVAELNPSKKVDAASVARRYCKKKRRYVPWNKSVVMFAVENTMVKLIEELNLTTAEWNACTVHGKNAFHFAAQTVSFQSVTLYELLKKKGVEQRASKDGRYPLHVAVASLNKSDVDVFTEPLKWFIKNETGLFVRDKDGCLPLHYCFIGLERDLSGTTTIDPVAVLSVLLSAMRKDMINSKDNWGYTALHFAAFSGANICVVNLLHAGAHHNVVNNDGNTPLALAVLQRKEACASTLIQAGSDVIRKIYLMKRRKETVKRREDWIWIPRRSRIFVEPPTTVASLIIRNEWQGIVYILLSIMGKNIQAVGSLVRACLEHRKYNLTLTLLDIFHSLLQDQSAEKAACLLEELDLFYVFVKNLATDIVDENILKVLNGLLQLGCKWCIIQKDGSYQSRIVECLASNGRFHFMKALYELDQKSDHPLWNLIKYDLNGDNPLVGIIEAWIKWGPKDGIKFWLKHFASQFGINFLMPYQRPAFDGMYPCLPRQPEPELCYMTALIRAIQCSNIELIQFLLQEEDLQTDLNKSDEFGVTPLMHCCMVNCMTAIQLLFDPSSLELQNKDARTTAVATNLSQKEVRENTTRKWVLKSNLDPFRESIISGRLTSNERKTKNFIHFMIKPCGWENTDLLQKLCDSLPQIKDMITRSTPDSTDSSPLHLAHVYCQTRMLTCMKNLTGMFNDLEVEYPVVDVSTIKTKYDIDADCECFLVRDAEARRERTRKEFMKTFLKPHENSGFTNAGEVLIKQSYKTDSEPIPYKVLLTKTQVNYGRFGYHSYYRMELIKHKSKELYILFTNWGRIGDPTGQYQRTPFRTLEEADKEFSAIFLSKTGNEFANIKNFEEKPMKYRLVEVSSDTAGNINDLEIDFRKSTAIDWESAKCLHYKLIKDISNVRRLQNRTRTVCHYQRSRIPFGCISRSDLLEALKVLAKLQNLMNDWSASFSETRSPATALKILREQEQATNEFYRLMPLSGFENSELPMVDNVLILREYRKLMENLFEMEVAGKLVTAAAYNMDRIDPYLYISDGLECELTVLDSNDLMTQRILQNIQITSSCSVEVIYAVKSRESAEAYNNNGRKLDNHRYLWHGTKPENMLSILKVGLLGSPANAVQTGQTFGEGIYFADVFSKSEQYCTVSESGFKYIVLCEVALGKVLYSNRSEYIRSEDNDQLTCFDSLKVIGKMEPDPRYDMTMENGCVLSLGDLIEVDTDEVVKRHKFNPVIDYNEYVVRDKTLTLVRYLVVFRYDFRPQ